MLTGAGISTDSGIRDFRGPNGVWTKDPKAERTSNIEYYVADPEVRRLAWQGRINRMGTPRQPNDGHRALVALDERGVLDLLVTQNIDGLHQAAGLDPARVVEIHGTIHEVVCLECGARSPVEPTLDRVRAGEDDPACLDCGGMLKSATISFGQSLVEADLDRAFEAAAGCDLLLAVGSTLSVYPVAGHGAHGQPDGRPDRDRQRRAHRDGRPGRRRGPGLHQRAAAGDGRPLTTTRRPPRRPPADRLRNARAGMIVDPSGSL